MNGTNDSIKISSTQFEEQYFSGIYIKHLSGGQIVGNNINILSTQFEYPEAIYISYGGGFNLLNNVINSKYIGLNLYYSQFFSTDSSFIINNIFKSNGYGSALTVKNYSSPLSILHNTIYTIDTSCVFLDFSNDDFILSNNILYRQNAGNILKIDGNNKGYINHNVYYTPGANDQIFKLDNNFSFSSLEEWSIYTGYDSNSVFMNPVFISDENLIPQNGSVSNIGNPTYSTNTDIYFNQRDSIYPDPGALEFEPGFVNDVWLKSVLSPNTPNCKLSDSIKVLCQNSGSDTIHAIKLAYFINDIPIDSVDIKIDIEPYGHQSLYLGKYTFKSNYDSLYIKTISVNNKKDLNNTNNSISKNNLIHPLSGYYTFGKTDADFIDLNELLNHLHYGGVCGPVFITFKNGIYELDKGFEISQIPGASETNTITFRSENMNPENVNIKPTSNGKSPYILFKNTGFIRFQNITFNLNALTNYHMVEFEGNVENIKFENNIILSDSANLSTIFYAYKARISDIEIVDNSISSAYNVIDFYSMDESGHLLIQNNTLTGNFRAAIELDNMYDVTITENNIHSQENGTVTGIDLYNINGPTIISHNIIRLDSSDYIGLIITKNYGTPGNEILIANNFIYVGGSHDRYPDAGVYFYESSLMKFINNTVHIKNSLDEIYTGALVLEYGGPEIIINNILVNSLGGSLIWIDKQNQPLVMDYNNYFGGTFILNDGTTGIPYNSLGEWQEYGYDEHSIFTDPLFKSQTDFHVCAPELNNAGSPFDLNTTDLEGDIRNQSTPDIGADEFTPYTPETGFIENETAVLCDSTIRLNVNVSADHYEWSTGDTLNYIDVTEIGEYILYVTNICGYDGSDTVTVIAPISELSAEISGFYGQFSFPYSDQILSFLWDFNDGSLSSEASPVHLYQNAGTYDVRLTLEYDCGAVILSKLINIESETGIFSPNIHDNAFELYPNPAKDIITLKINQPFSENETFMICFYNSTGTILKQTQIFSKEINRGIAISVADFQKGIYFINLSTSTFTLSKSFIKQ